MPGCCLAFPAWVTGRASVHNCSRDIKPWGPECLALLRSYTASLQNYSSVPWSIRNQQTQLFSPFHLARSVFHLLKEARYIESFMDQERGCLEAWPLQELVVYTVLWPCAMIGVSSPGAFPPSMASLLPCLDSPSAPAKNKTHKASLKPTFWSTHSTSRPPPQSSHEYPQIAMSVWFRDTYTILCLEISCANAFHGGWWSIRRHPTIAAFATV